VSHGVDTSATHQRGGPPRGTAEGSLEEAARADKAP
jgi:hypothetical protein